MAIKSWTEESLKDYVQHCKEFYQVVMKNKYQ